MTWRAGAGTTIVRDAIGAGAGTNPVPAPFPRTDDSHLNACRPFTAGGVRVTTRRC